MAPKNKLNVLLISFDDAVAPWPYKTAFAEPLQTPNLDRICEVSTAFHAAYSPATVCNPARASIMSGRSPHDIQILSNKHDVFALHPPNIMWSHRLKENEYFCSYGGKVHHPYRPYPLPLHRKLYSDERKNFVYSGTETPRMKNLGGWRDGAATIDPEDDKTHYDFLSANSAVDFLSRYDEPTPFYREVGFQGPHTPWITPIGYKHMYRTWAFEKPQSWAEGYDRHPWADKRFPRREQLMNGALRWWKQTVRNYYSSYSFADAQLGRIWDALQKSRHADNTLVIIMSDHGYHLGNKDRLEKRTLWEQTVHVPLIVHLPGQQKGSVVNTPVSSVDIGPTILDYLNLGKIAGSPGQSLRPYLENKKAPERAIVSYFFGHCSMRYGQYRLIRYRDGSIQLYDLENDYWCLHDLGSEHPEFNNLYQTMMDTSRDWFLELPAYSMQERSA